MELHTLIDAGLTHGQAKAYKMLVETNGSDAPSLSPLIEENRSNTYKLLDKLCDMGLAHKDQSGAKTIYIPANPSTLIQHLEEQSADIALRNRKLKAAMPDLLDYYFEHAEQPGIHFYQGKQEIKQIFSDMLKTGQTLYLLRTPSDVGFYDEGFFAEVRKKRRALGLKTIGITPDVISANHDAAVDEHNLFERTWIPEQAYTANVEWNVAGDKVGLISYGKEAIGMVIESPQIAESFRQVFTLIKEKS